MNSDCASWPAVICAGEAALEFIERGSPADIMLTDLHMPSLSGVDMMRRLQGRLPPYPVVRTCLSCCPLPLPLPPPLLPLPHLLQLLPPRPHPPLSPSLTVVSMMASVAPPPSPRTSPYPLCYFVATPFSYCSATLSPIRTVY